MVEMKRVSKTKDTNIINFSIHTKAFAVCIWGFYAFLTKQLTMKNNYSVVQGIPFENSQKEMAVPQ